MSDPMIRRLREELAEANEAIAESERLHEELRAKLEAQREANERGEAGPDDRRAAMRMPTVQEDLRRVEAGLRDCRCERRRLEQALRRAEQERAAANRENLP